MSSYPLTRESHKCKVSAIKSVTFYCWHYFVKSGMREVLSDISKSECRTRTRIVNLSVAEVLNT